MLVRPIEQVHINIKTTKSAHSIILNHFRNEQQKLTVSECYREIIHHFINCVIKNGRS